METQRLNDHSVVTQLSSQKCLLLGHMPTLQFFIFLLLFVCFLVYFLLKDNWLSLFSVKPQHESAIGILISPPF